MIIHTKLDQNQMKTVREEEAFLVKSFKTILTNDGGLSEIDKAPLTFGACELKKKPALIYKISIL